MKVIRSVTANLQLSDRPKSRLAAKRRTSQKGGHQISGHRLSDYLSAAGGDLASWPGLLLKHTRTHSHLFTCKTFQQTGAKVLNKPNLLKFGFNQLPNYLANKSAT